MSRADTIREWAISKVGCPYIFASNGQICMPAFRQRQEANKPAYAVNIKRYCPVRSAKQSSCNGCQYKDKQSYDCSGLTKEAAKLIGINMPHGASSQWKGDYWDLKGPVARMPMDKVCFVYNAMDAADPMGHVGIYLGDGTVVDARSHAKGVLRTSLLSYAWDHFGILKGMYDEAVDAVLYLAVGARGQDVENLQRRLNEAGFDCGLVDGIFGPKTANAVKALQTYAQLLSTGIVDDPTQKALEHALAKPEPCDDRTLAQAVYAVIKDYL